MKLRSNPGRAVGLLAVFGFSAVTGCDSRSAPRSPVEAIAEAAPARPKRYYQPAAGMPVFFIRTLFADVQRSAFAYELLPCGAVRFIDAHDHREYCMTLPFELRERRFPKSAVADGPAKDTSAIETAMNDKPKFYMISSYLTEKRTRFQTFKYRIDQNGTVHFAHGNDRLAIPPPYIIEEDFIAEGHHPKLPDYPPSPDRG